MTMSKYNKNYLKKREQARPAPFSGRPHKIICSLQKIPLAELQSF